MAKKNLNLSIIIKISVAFGDHKSLTEIQNAMKKLKKIKKIKIQDLENIKGTNVYKIVGEEID